jgi:DNA-binding response OmpR family regulator
LIKKILSGPIIGVTGNSRQMDIETFQASGVDDVILKPLKYKELVNKLEG